MWERLGTILISIGILVVGVTTMAAYQTINAGTTYYNAFVLTQNSGILQGSAWILVAVGFLVRFYPRTNAGDHSEP